MLPGNSNYDTLIGCMVLDNCSRQLRTQEPIGLIFEKAGDDSHFFSGVGASIEFSHLPFLFEGIGFDFIEDSWTGSPGFTGYSFYRSPDESGKIEHSFI